MKLCFLCLGPGWRSRSLHRENVEVSNLPNGGQEDRTGEIKPGGTSAVLSCLEFPAPVSCRDVRAPSLQQHAAAALHQGVGRKSELWTGRSLHINAAWLNFSCMITFCWRSSGQLPLTSLLPLYVGHFLLWFTVVMSKHCSIVWTNKYAFLFFFFLKKRLRLLCSLF